MGSALFDKGFSNRHHMAINQAQQRSGRKLGDAVAYRLCDTSDVTSEYGGSNRVECRPLDDAGVSRIDRRGNSVNQNGPELDPRNGKRATEYFQHHGFTALPCQEGGAKPE